jgi:hypothetical protein
MRLLKVLLASLFVSSAAVAGEVNGLHYGSFSLAYSHTTSKGTNDDGDEIKFDAFKGPMMNAEALVADKILLGLTYGQIKSSNVSVDGVAQNVKSKLATTFVSVGYRFEIGKGADVIPFVEHRRFKISIEGDPDESNNDTALGFQLRTALSPAVELHLTIDRDDEKTNGIRGRTVYKFDKSWATFLGYARESGRDSYRGGITTLGVSYLF